MSEVPPVFPPKEDGCRRARDALLYRVSSSLVGPVVSSIRALSGRLKFTVRRHKFNKDFLSLSSLFRGPAEHIIKDPDPLCSLALFE